MHINNRDMESATHLMNHTCHRWLPLSFFFYALSFSFLSNGQSADLFTASSRLDGWVSIHEKDAYRSPSSSSSSSFSESSVNPAGSYAKPDWDTKNLKWSSARMASTSQRNSKNVSLRSCDKMTWRIAWGGGPWSSMCWCLAKNQPQQYDGSGLSPAQKSECESLAHLGSWETKSVDTLLRKCLGDFVNSQNLVSTGKMLCQYDNCWNDLNLSILFQSREVDTLRHGEGKDQKSREQVITWITWSNSAWWV